MLPVHSNDVQGRGGRSNRRPVSAISGPVRALPAGHRDVALAAAAVPAIGSTQCRACRATTASKPRPAGSLLSELATFTPSARCCVNPAIRKSGSTPSTFQMAAWSCRLAMAVSQAGVKELGSGTGGDDLRHHRFRVARARGRSVPNRNRTIVLCAVPGEAPGRKVVLSAATKRGLGQDSHTRVRPWRPTRLRLRR